MGLRFEQGAVTVGVDRGGEKRFGNPAVTQKLERPFHQGWGRPRRFEPLPGDGELEIENTFQQDRHLAVLPVLRRSSFALCTTFVIHSLDPLVGFPPDASVHPYSHPRQVSALRITNNSPRIAGSKPAMYNQ